MNKVISKEQLIQNHADIIGEIYLETNNGWNNILNELFWELKLISKTTGIRIVPMQIKEKFGGMDFHWIPEFPSEMDDNTDTWLRIIDSCICHTRRKSNQVCDVCGEWGKHRKLGHWLRTLCDEHNPNKEEETE